jgi:pyrroloquinoline quinone (PQQ) biosynthesis protein C
LVYTHNGQQFDSQQHLIAIEGGISMATETIDRTFVDSILNEIVRPAADRLMESRYFTDLRNGTLTTRRLQGFSLSHTWFNRSLLKGGALRMIKASDNDAAFMGALRGLEAEITHPDMCKKFGLKLGLTEEDFQNYLPVHEVLAHTSVVVAGALILGGNLAAGRASGMTNETIVQRYATEFCNYLSKAPYNLDEDTLEFFYVHGEVDIAHSAMAADAVARNAITDRDKELVRYIAENQVRLKLAKFEGIYDAYA